MSVYNGRPDPFNGNAIVSCAPGTVLLPDGMEFLFKINEQDWKDTPALQQRKACVRFGSTVERQSVSIEPPRASWR